MRGPSTDQPIKSMSAQCASACFEKLHPGPLPVALGSVGFAINRPYDSEDTERLTLGIVPGPKLDPLPELFPTREEKQAATAAGLACENFGRGLEACGQVEVLTVRIRAFGTEEGIGGEAQKRLKGGVYKDEPVLGIEDENRLACGTQRRIELELGCA